MLDRVKIEKNLNDCLNVIRLYDWLLDSFVLEYFVDNHWGRLQSSWANAFDKIAPEDLAGLLIPEQKESNKIVWPLSLLSLKELSKHITIDRKTINLPKKSSHTKSSDQNGDPNNNPNETINCLLHPKIKPVLTQKNIKEKKRHEIERMSRYTAEVAENLDVQYIVDFGAGLGHLARSLAYGYKLNVCCLEKEPEFTKQARLLDDNIEGLVGKYYENTDQFPRPVHLNICLGKDTLFSDLIKQFTECFNIAADDKTFKFGIIGLHPCGDLAAILIKFFLQSPEAKFLNLVGCCYFKITTTELSSSAELDVINANDIDSNVGYPLSQFLRTKSYQHLSFESREIACHAIELYTNRLSAGDYEYLRVHSYRATIEKIICKHWPERRRLGLKSIKHLSTFREYCKQAVLYFDDIEIADEDIDAPETVNNLNSWKCVVIFYTLRLMLAPIVESAILYDRMLSLQENGCKTEIKAIFDPSISSRNHIITAIKS